MCDVPSQLLLGDGGKCVYELSVGPGLALGIKLLHSGDGRRRGLGRWWWRLGRRRELRLRCRTVQQWRVVHAVCYRAIPADVWFHGKYLHYMQRGALRFNHGLVVVHVLPSRNVSSELWQGRLCFVPWWEVFVDDWRHGLHELPGWHISAEHWGEKNQL